WPPTCAEAIAARRSGATAPGRWPGRTRLLGEWLRTLPDPPPPVLAGRLATAWRGDPGLRDACLAGLTSAGAGAAHDLLAGRRTEEALDEVTAGCDPRSLEVAGHVLRPMAALLPPPERAVVLAGHAWLAWGCGDGTRALVLAERALDDDPGVRLAALVLGCLEHGLGPRAARRGLGGSAA
ncbi:DUF4192 family protein, partial [Aquipuribacter sp. SD81]|uniref:DUF4192 family protein n=1 Tax=Aquipuribacter sp. SD81 TaxID=3127703 RepID=UPI0030199A24